VARTPNESKWPGLLARVGFWALFALVTLGEYAEGVLEGGNQIGAARAIAVPLALGVFLLPALLIKPLRTPTRIYAIATVILLLQLTAKGLR
jgi:hypothetical protein